MTGHRCCPECGAELAADGATFCGCAGPFTAEHVDPMHIRPYVDLPEPEEEAPSAPPPVPDLEPFARCGQGETAELPVVGPLDGAQGRPAAAAYDYDGYDGYEGYGDHEGPGRPGGPVREPQAPHAPSASRGGDHRRVKGGGAYGRDNGTARRRRTGRAALAAAGVVAALGAGLLTTQSLTGDESGDDRSLSTDDTALPDPPSGGPTEDPSRTEERKRDKKTSAAPTSRTASAGSRADRNGSEHTDRVPAPPRTSSSAAPGAPGGWDGRDGDDGWGGGGGHDGGQDRPWPPQDSTQPDDDQDRETLRAGDRGPEVAELQRRLKQAGVLDESAPEDGFYSPQVQQAVAHYQARNGVRGDDFGEYGPNTRRALESETSG